MIAHADAYRCYSTADGRRKHFLGCSHEHPRQAIAHTSGTYVPPLRVSAGASTPVPVPPAVPGPLDAPAEPLGWLDITDPPRP